MTLENGDAVAREVGVRGKRRLALSGNFGNDRK
jgi:hypothetical protein